MTPELPRKNWQRIIAVALIILVTVAVIIGAWRISADTPVPLENATATYADAVSLLNIKSNVYYKVTGKKSFTVQDTEFKEQFTRYITIENRGTDNLRIRVEEDLAVGDYDINRFDIYADETEYLTVQGISFCSATTSDAFINRNIPDILLDAALYAEITGTRTSKQTEIRFSKGGATEKWVIDAGASIVDAEGVAYLNENSELEKSEYTAKYLCGDIPFTLTVSLEILSGETAAITTPDTSLYTQTDAIETPLLLEKACGYLLSAESLIADYADQITCQAFGDDRTQEVHLETSLTDSWTARMDTIVSATNSSKAGVVTTTTKNELFEDNAYSIATNGGDYVKNPDIDQVTMKGYCENLLIGTIILPQYISAITYTETDTASYISFKATEDFAQVLAAEACTTLYQSPTVLNNMAQSYSTNTVTCYITLDRFTGFPISSGFYYLGTYTISNLPYELLFKADQAYTLPTESISTDNTEATEYTEAQEASAS